jgi:hypothetical protein
MPVTDFAIVYEESVYCHRASTRGKTDQMTGGRLDTEVFV